MVHARDSVHNWRKASKGFFSWTMHRVRSKSSLCHSPGEALQDGVSSVAIQPLVPDISGGTNTQVHKHTNTHADRHRHRIHVILYKIILVFCVCVCVSVCPTWDIWNGRSNHHAACTITKSFTWQVVQNAFEPIQLAVWEKKPLKCLLQLRAKSCARTVTLPLIWGRMNLAQYKKAVGPFSKGMHWRTCPPHHGCNSCYCFLREWAINN